MILTKTARTVALAALLLAVVPAASAATPQTNDITDRFRAAGAAVDRLQVYEIAGIVIIRGRVSDKSQAELMSRYATELGYQRVANLIQTVEHDDDRIARAAERELTIHRSLDGCRFSVSANKGVVRVGGQVRHELQKDVAVQVVRSIHGVRAVEMKLNRF